MTHSGSPTWIISSSVSAGRSCDLFLVKRTQQRWWDYHPLPWLHKFCKTLFYQSGERFSCWPWKRKLHRHEGATWQGTAGAWWVKCNPWMAVSKNTGTSVLQPQELNFSNSSVSLEEQFRLQNRTYPSLLTTSSLVRPWEKDPGESGPDCCPVELLEGKISWL